MRSKVLWLTATAIFFTLVGCANSGKSDAEITAPVVDAVSVYNYAVKDAAQLKDMALIISEKETVTTGEEVYIQQIRQNILYNNYGTEQMIARQTEARSYGDYQVAVESAFRDGNCYFNVSGANYQSIMTAEEYCKMYVPVVLLDRSLYKTISAETSDKTTVCNFSDPIGIESWAAPGNAILLDAKGSAILDADNRLISSNYSVQYQCDNRTFTRDVSVSINPAKPKITFPDTSEYIPLSLPDAPILIEQSVGHLMQTRRVTSVTSEKIVCEVFGDTRTQTTTLNMYADDKTYGAQLDINTLLENPSRADKATRQQQQIRFADGVYTAIVNGQASKNNDISQEQMKVYCKDYLLSTIMMSKYITSIEVSQNETEYKLIFTANEEMATMMRQHACEILYGDASVLDELADSYKTDSITGFITIDVKTLVPISSGIYYAGAHQINGVEYPLIFETIQSYTIPSDSAFTAIYP